VPEISVLVPMFNAQATLVAALKSLRRQTFTDWECVLCDDGSTDSTLEISATYARDDSRFMVTHRAHGGLVSTLNWGMQQCRGATIARFDADDIAHRERFLTQHQFLLNHPEFAGVGCAVRMFPRAELTEGHRSYETWLNSLTSESDIIRDRFVECPLAHPTWLLRRDVLLAHGYRDQRWPEDYDLILRLLGAGCRLSTVRRRLLFWRDGPSRLSRNDGAYGLESFTRCRAHFLASDWLSGNEHYGLWGYGSTGRNLARALIQYGKHPAYIVELHPRRIGQRILGVPVIAPEGLTRVRRPGDRLVISVAGQNQRNDAREIAKSLNLVENVDFVCAA
jgi:glycosyltransferase involved in cell wall biosynthesis